MNVVSLKKGKVSINIDGPITIGNHIYPNILLIGRLLTIPELTRVDSFFSERTESNIVIEEDIFDLCVESIVGLNNDILETLDKDSLEAGIISTIAMAITAKSYHHILASKHYIDRFEESVTVIDSIILIVSKYTSTKYEEVRNLPINELLERFAIIKKTFPNEVTLVEQ